MNFCSRFYDTEARKSRRGQQPSTGSSSGPSVSSNTEKEGESANLNRNALQSGEELVKGQSRHPAKIWGMAPKAPAYHLHRIKKKNQASLCCSNVTFHSESNSQRQHKIYDFSWCDALDMTRVPFTTKPLDPGST